MGYKYKEFHGDTESQIQDRSYHERERESCVCFRNTNEYNFMISDFLKCAHDTHFSFLKYFKTLDNHNSL